MKATRTTSSAHPHGSLGADHEETIEKRRLHLVTEGRIDADAGPASAIWAPVPRDPDAPLTTSAVLHDTRNLVTERLPAALEDAITAVLTRPLRPEEGHHVGGLAREAELRTLFAQLGRVQAFHLRRRLDREHAGDELARAFRRLTPERRGRLRAQLDEPRGRD